MQTVIDEHIAEQVAELLLSIGAVSFNVKKPFRYTSGILSPMYTDNRLLISYPHVWQQIIGFYAAVMEKAEFKQKIDCLSGTATAAIPHAAGLAYKLHLPMVYVRSSKKEHGKENQIEGTFPTGSHVLVIEDLISTGKSIKVNCDAIREAGGIVDTCLAITTSTMHAYEPIVQELGVRLITLSNVTKTLEVAVASKRITNEERTSVESFLADPPGWGKKMGFE
jgi:orotate phosphoribosyltransferase